MLAHSTFYSKLHSILTDKWGDDPEFPRTTTSQKDAGCILDKFMGSLEEQDLNTVEVSEYFSKSYHIMNLTCQGSEVTGIVVQQALDSYSYSDHTAENLRFLFYTFLLRANDEQFGSAAGAKVPEQLGSICNGGSRNATLNLLPTGTQALSSHVSSVIHPGMPSVEGNDISLSTCSVA